MRFAVLLGLAGCAAPAAPARFARGIADAVENVRSSASCDRGGRTDGDGLKGACRRGMTQWF